jgi:hypothetical protein
MDVGLSDRFHYGGFFTSYSLQKCVSAYPTILQEQIHKTSGNLYNSKHIFGNAIYHYWWYLDVVSLVAERRKI